MSNDISWLQARLAGAGPAVVIDGGMGTLLEQSAVPMDGKVWSGRAVLTHPDAVVQAHEAYITAGAEVIIANTFAAARHMLEPGGLGDHVRDINLKAVSLAQQARDNVATETVAIAGSICEWAPTDDPKWHTPEPWVVQHTSKPKSWRKPGSILSLWRCASKPIFRLPLSMRPWNSDCQSGLA